MEEKTPKSLGFHFPGEWELHDATWLTYPQNPESWPENLPEVWKEYNDFVKEISMAEKVHINVNNTNLLDDLSESLYRLGCKMENIYFHVVLSDDCWCRDHGPIFLTHPKKDKAIVNADFNAWGNKYAASNDNLIATKITEITGYRSFKPGIVMEGGSLENNGNGTILTTKACLLNENRNPGFSLTELEEYIKQYYCTDQVLWLENGIAGDDTDGHIDDIARFVDQNTLILAIEEDKKNINYEVLKNNLHSASRFRIADHAQVTVVELLMPEVQYLSGQPMPASYANFYICNAGVIVPIFHCKNDQKAVDILQYAFPNKKIIPLSAVNVIQGLGSWHCLSQQEPAV